MSWIKNFEKYPELCFGALNNQNQGFCFDLQPDLIGIVLFPYRSHWKDSVLFHELVHFRQTETGKLKWA